MSKLGAGVGAIVLFVEDIARARTFYRDILELSISFEDEESVVLNIHNTMIVLLRLDAAQGLLTGGRARTAAGTDPTFQLSVFVDDVDEIHSQLVERGVAFLIAPINRVWGKRTAHFKDPDGYVWELAQDIAV